jgi:hypothetical protein
LNAASSTSKENHQFYSSVGKKKIPLLSNYEMPTEARVMAGSGMEHNYFLFLYRQIKAVPLSCQIWPPRKPGHCIRQILDSQNQSYTVVPP